MNPSKRHLTKILLVGGLVGCILFGWLIFRQVSPVQAHQRAVMSAWDLLSRVGYYRFSTTIEQRVFPAPTMSNAGQSSELEVYNVDGWSRVPSGELFISFWDQDDSSAGTNDALEIKYTQGQAYSRNGESEWMPIDDQGDMLVAPGKDPASFLSAAKGVRLENRERIELPQADGSAGALNVSRYSFDMDGSKFASFMRDQMMSELQRSGKLPSGMTLSLSDKLLGMDGSGQVWIDEDGMLVRMLVEIRFPDEVSGEHVEAKISTTFYGVTSSDVMAAKGIPAQLSSWMDLPATGEGWTQTAFTGGFVGFLFLAFYSLISNSSRRWCYATVAVLVMISLLVDPLWRSAKAASFIEEQHLKQIETQAAQEQAREQKSALVDLLTSSWLPNVAPQEQLQPAGNLDPIRAAVFDALSVTQVGAAAAANQQDSDGDGLTDDYEDEYGPTILDKTKADTDGDGLLDGQELPMGLLPGQADSDNDQISDYVEAIGFYFDTGMWYTNPDEQDTDFDGIMDGVECPQRAVTAANPAAGVCADLDGDGLPNPFDSDDDGDGVPTMVDASPYTALSKVFSPTSPLVVEGSGVETGMPVFVTYQFRPQEAEHLTYTQNVLDWPSNDTSGQIQRVVDSTFSSISTNPSGGDARAAYGDLRLIPMIEVRFKGSSLPLKPTSSYAFPISSDNFEGELELAALSATSTRVMLTQAPAGSHPIYLGSGSCDNATGMTLIGSLAQGQSANVNLALGEFADGDRPFQVRDAAGAAVVACQEAYPVAHGTWIDQVVDESTINPYGIFTRTDAASGEVILYSPLQLVYNETGSMPVAFSARLPLTNEGDRFNTSRQEVSLVWALNLVSDICKPIDPAWTTAQGEWCDSQYPDHYVKNVARIVHTYPENFQLAGLSISEQRGVKMAVAFENPATDTQPEFYDPLWALAKGLETSFLAGRAAGGARDMTVETIRDRFDPDFNSAIPAGDNRLWGFEKNAFQVEYVGGIATSDGLIERMQTLSTDIFNSYFSGASAPETTVLLFARELRERSSGLGQPGNDCYTGTSPSQCTISFAGEVESVQAVMNWAPYQRAGTTWSAYPMASFLDRLESNLRTLPDFKPQDASDQARAEMDGKIFLARMYAEMMYRGLATLVELNNAPVVNEAIVADDTLQTAILDNMRAVGAASEKVATMFAEIFLTALYSQPLLNMVIKTGSMGDKVSAFMETVGNGLKDKVNSLVAKYLNTTFRKVAAVTGAVILIAGIVACAIIYLASPDSQEGQIAGRVLNSTLGVISTILAIKGLVELYKIIQLGQTITKAAATAAVVGLIIGLVVVWAMFFVSWGLSGAGIGSLAFNNMFAEAVAASMALVLMAAIAMIFPVGTIIAAVVALIDAVIMSVCAIAGASDLGEDHWVNKYICIGLSGWVTKIFKWVFYGVNNLIDYDNGDRLEFGGLTQVLEHPANGYIDTNRMKVTIETTNTITKESIPLDWKSLAYFWQWSDSNARSANFQYRVQPAETDFHEDLERGGMSPAWVDAGDDVWKATVDATTTGYAIDLPDAGINREPDVYLSEASAIPVQECWAIPPLILPIWIPVCYIRTERATIHVDLSKSMAIDVFPATLTKFYELTEVSRGGYSVAWGTDATPKFPIFRDADGDTLVSPHYGGNDPNDSDFDNDNDGLSDAFEVQKGYNPNLPDSDDDGLLDASEVRLGTNPMRPDSDGDGLPDAEEAAGWFFTYGFDANGFEQRTKVYPDPLMVDTDLDGLTDKQEQVYGFNPRVFSDSSILDYSLATQEFDASQVLIRFDEASGASLFPDSSNYNFHGSCQADACPSAGLEGRYGQAVQLDGGLTAGNPGDVVEVSGSALGLDFTGSRPFSLAFWIERQGSGTILSKWSETVGDRKEFKLELTDSGFLRLVNQSGAAVLSSTAVPSGVWTHAALSYNGTSVTFLINGLPAGTQAWSNPSTAGTAVPLRIGAATTAGGTGDYFAGKLDEMLIFNRAVAASEVSERLMAARYNVNDQFVRPGEFLNFMSVVSNLLNNRFAYGLLTNQIEPQNAVVDAQSKLLPRTFVLYPDTPQKLNTLNYSEQLQIEPTYSVSGDLTLGQTVDAQIVDRQTESNYAELWLKFNEAANATRFEDFSGATPQREATCTSCPASGQTGILNQAVNFAASGDTPLTLTTTSTFSLLNRGFTISMWINPASTTTSGAVLSLLDTASGEFDLSLVREASGNYAPRIVMDGQTWTASAWRSVLTGVWNHMVVRYNDNDRQVLVYLNGAQIYARSNVDPLIVNSLMRLGGTPQQSSYLVDDLRIYSRPLSTLDINRLAERPVLELNMDTSAFSDTSGNNQSVSHELAQYGPDGISVRGTSLFPNSGGSLNYLQVNGNPLLNMQDGAFTFSTWIYPQTSGETAWQGVFGYESGRTDAYPTLERNGRRLRLRFGTGSAVYLNESSDVLTEGRWNHVVVTFQPNTDPTLPGTYQYRLYVNARYVDGDITASHPGANTTFLVGHSSHRWTMRVNSVYVSGSDDAGSYAEVEMYKKIDSQDTSRFWTHDVKGGNTYIINEVDNFTTYSQIYYDVWEDDNIGDDHCGSGTYYHSYSPGNFTLGMSDGFNGTLYLQLIRESIRFVGRLDELAVYRYALDSEQIYDLYYSIPLTARLPLNDRPSSDTFVNTAEVTSLDDGTCVGTACPAAGVLGLLDQAVEFAGVDDVINIPNRNVTSDYMVSFWMNTTCLNCGVYSLYPTTPGTTAMQQIYLRSGNVCALAGGTEVCSTGGGISDGRWHSVLYWNNGSRADLWVDGQVVNSRSSGGTVTASAAAQIRLGVAVAGGADYYAGMLDDVRVYRYTLPNADILNVLNRSPLLLAHLDEAQDATNFIDSTQHGKNLVCSGAACPMAGQPGRLGGSPVLDGVDDLLTLEQAQLAADTESFSVSLWVKPTRTVNAVQTVWALPYADNNRIRYSLAVQPNSMNLCLVKGDAGAACASPSLVSLIKDNWNFVTLVVERGTATTENYFLYINGYIDSFGPGNQGANVVNGLGRMTLGGKLPAHAGQAGGAFAGQMDEVTVYPYELNEINVRDSFNYQIAHVEEHESVRLTIDAEAPQVSLAGYDASFAYIQQNDIQLVVPASDETSGMGLVEMSVSHRNLTTPRLSTAPVCLDSVSGEDFCPTLRPASGDGRYTLQFRAVDRVGHQTISAPYDIYADGGAPRIVVDFAESSLLPTYLHPELKNTWALWLSGNVQDPELGDGAAGSGLDLNSVKVSIVSADGAVIGNGTQWPVLVKDPSGPGYLWTLEYLLGEKEPSGEFTLVVEASDRVNNQALSETAFAIDSTAPSAQIDLAGLPAEDEVLTQGSFGGSISDVPGEGLPYTGSGNPSLAVNVAQSQVGFLPVGTTSFLHNDPYPDGLLLWLPLDKVEVPLDANGDPNPGDPRRTFMDISAYQIAGTCSGAECPAEGLAGHYSASMFFDGNEKTIRLGNQVDLAGRSFTVAVWSKREEMGRNDPILWQGPLSLPDQRILVGINADDQFVCGFGGTDLAVDPAWVDTHWHMWVCSYDAVSGRRAIFRDGLEITSDTANPLPVMYEPLFVGQAPVGSFYGYLDELQIFDRALDAESVRREFTGYQTVFHLGVDSSFLVTGMSLADQSGFFHSAQLLSGTPDKQNKIGAGAGGSYGLELDGDDLLKVAPGYSLNLDRGAYTLAAWVRPDRAAAMDVISQADENPEWRYPLLGLTSDLRLRTGFGNGYAWKSAETTLPAVAVGEWSFLTVTFDGQTTTFYVNGVLVEESNALAGLIPYSVETFNIGEAFSGGIDEVMVLPRAINGLEAAALAKSGWSAAQLAGSGAQTDWIAEVPGGVEGIYRLGARGWDTSGHVKTGFETLNQWDGVVDTIAPRLQLARTEVEPDIWEYTFSIEDVFLVEDTILINVCPAAAVVRTYNNSEWLLSSGMAPNSAPLRLEGTCRAETNWLEEVGVYGCDSAGNCSGEFFPPVYGFQVFMPLITSISTGGDTAAPVNPVSMWERVKDWPALVEALAQEDGALGPQVDLLTQQLGATDFRSLSFFPIKGLVFDESGTARVEVRISRGGVEIYRTRAALYDRHWTAMWGFAVGTRPENGLYTIEVTAVDRAGNSTTLSSDLTVSMGGGQ